MSPYAHESCILNMCAMPCSLGLDGINTCSSLGCGILRYEGFSIPVLTEGESGFLTTLGTQDFYGLTRVLEKRKQLLTLAIKYT